MNQFIGKSYFQQRQRNRLYETVIKAVEQGARAGIRKKDIAKKIGITPSQVSHFLSGPANWTVDSISDILYAVGMEMNYHAVEFKDQARSNQFHPVSAIESLATPKIVPSTSGTSGADTRGPYENIQSRAESVPPTVKVTMELKT